MITRIVTFLILLSFNLSSYPQPLSTEKKEILTSINSNLIDIENSNPDYAFKENTKLKNLFQDVKIYGFGEATHGTKEFQDLKAKFFRYLVLNCNVKIFAIEANFGDCLAINSYIREGKGNAKESLRGIGYWIWQTDEILSLVEWMKAYNTAKTEENKLSFMGIDVMNCQNSATILHNYLDNNNSTANQKVLTVLSNYTSIVNSKKIRKKDFIEHYQILKSLELELKSLKDPFLWQLNNSVLQYILMRIDFTQTLRDKLMSENINWLIENNIGNVFISAHNIHVSKKNVSFNPLGYYLKNKYSEKYYSVGFDFGSGNFNAFDVENNLVKKYSVDQPLKGSSTQVFYKASSDIFLLDFCKSTLSPTLSEFVKSKSFRRGVGSTFSLKMVETEKLAETFDAILFVKKSNETSLLK